MSLVASPLTSVDALTEPATLTRVLGRDVVSVRVEPLTGIGFSNASLSRVEIEIRGGERCSFVLKRMAPSADWIANRTGDVRGREAQLLSEPLLNAVWDAVASPYLAWALGGGEAGLLMTDLSSALMPDARIPLSAEQEQSLLGALARLHARFWETDLSSVGWLVRPAQFCDLVAPCLAADPAAVASLPPQLRDAVPRGWVLALARLPREIARHLKCPGSEWEARWLDLPRTFLHGDVKVANFALPPDGSVAAFDWALAGAGPCTIDVGWYLAVNASRLTTSKEELLVRYRALLEAARGSRFPDSLWQRLEDIAIVTGARMLLWSKALALDAGRPGAVEEWNWWVDRLIRVPVYSV
jgi:hypothetical protein